MIKKSRRYITNQLIEDQFEPGSKKRVLKNLQGITTIKQMDKAENYALMVVLLKAVKKYTANHSFTVKDLCQLHKEWLGDIYPWAGSYRNVDLVKEDFRFAHAKYIPNLMSDFEKKILKKYTPCHFQEIGQLAEVLAIVHVEFVLIHPFREGNGRLARLLASLMALQSLFPTLNYGKMSKNKSRYIKAIHEGVKSNYQPMKKIFIKIIEESFRIAFSSASK